MREVRVRFAPSPTGPLHIGGVRTALYNYLFAKKYNGRFILRIEDTDRNRYVQGAEDYIGRALSWLGIDIDESVDMGGDYGPYRQSDRANLYMQFVRILIDNGSAYYAFDSEEELENMRQEAQNKGVHSPKYDAGIRMNMRNSLTLSKNEVDDLLTAGHPYVIRMKIPEHEEIHVHDVIRGDIRFQSSELDDKVIMKTDGMPTYHLANIIDDHEMKISHVIRGEEWLSSTAHHVLLYRGFGWEDEMPEFAHLPLILKPTGKGKLSKRDGDKLGIPVFPLSWKEQEITGFDEFGFDPQAVINFLAFLGWNPGTEQEIFSMDALIAAFDLQKIGKSGARFDFDKAKWYNQQYILEKEDSELCDRVAGLFIQHNIHQSNDFIQAYVSLFKERAVLYTDFISLGVYLYDEIQEYDQKTIRKKWKSDMIPLYEKIGEMIANISPFNPASIETGIKRFMATNEIGFGQLFPILRVAMTGTTRGADLFKTMAILGQTKCISRWNEAMRTFPELTTN